MAYRKKRVGEVSTGAMIGIGAVVLIGAYFLMQKSAPALPAPIIKQTGPSTSAVVDTALINAAANVSDTLINDAENSDS